MRWSKYEADRPDQPASPQRRDFIKTAATTAAVGTGAALTAGAALAGDSAGDRLATQQADAGAALGENWWPSAWGAEDQSGATNHMSPEKTLESVRLIEDGRVYRIGRVYESGMPLFGARVFALRTSGTPTGGPFGNNQLVYNDEFLAAEIGQVGTQFDGLGHIGAVMGQGSDQRNHRYYNGLTGDDVLGPYGLKKLGIEHCRPFFTRGHLVDMEAFRGGAMDAGDEITVADMTGALEQQGMSPDDIAPGDAVFFNTGWGKLWMENNDRYASGAPGIGIEAAEFLADKGISVSGADTWPLEVVPNPNPDMVFPVHQIFLTQNGIYIQENLVFDELIADGKYRFAYIFSPLPIKGATGSPGAPIAVT